MIKGIKGNKSATPSAATGRPGQGKSGPEKSTFREEVTEAERAYNAPKPDPSVFRVALLFPRLLSRIVEKMSERASLDFRLNAGGQADAMEILERIASPSNAVSAQARLKEGYQEVGVPTAFLRGVIGASSTDDESKASTGAKSA